MENNDNENNNNDMELEDMVYTYPDINNPDFQTIITSKKEFNESSTSKTEPIPSRGKFFKHQELIHRYMLVYDKLLVIHKPGTGKSGTASGLTEQLRRDTLEATTNFVDEYIIPKRTHIKTVYYLVKNDTLKSQIKKEIVCKYSAPGSYETDKILKSVPGKSRKLNITNEIKKYYQIKTFTKFGSDLYKANLTDQQIIDEYSGSIFIFDEVHNIRIEEKSFEYNELLDTYSITTSTDLREQVKIYKAYHRLFHLILRSKIMLMTATPMINDVSEIGLIMNLILPINKQMPIDQSFYELIPENPAGITDQDINNHLIKFERYYRGLISYVGESTSFAKPVNRGIIFEDVYYLFNGKYIQSTQKLYTVMMENRDFDDPSIMSQAKAYEMYHNDKSAFKSKARQASNFTFPDGSTGTKGAAKYIKNFFTYTMKLNKKTGIEERIKVDITTYEPNNNLLQWVSNLEYIRYLSAKFYTCIKLTEESKGNVFIFSPFRVGSGALLLGMCFRYFNNGRGYKVFEHNESIFKSSNLQSQNVNEYCPPSTGSRENRQTKNDIYAAGTLRQDGSIEPYSYAIITSGLSANRVATILETYNSYENRHGDYIKCLIVTPIAREGINTANTVTYINLGPGWNRALMFQSEYRVLRATSHDDLLNEMKELYISIGRDPEEAKIIVEMYNLTAISPITNSSVDVEMYQISEKKDIEIRDMENIMHSVAIDCQINYERNIKSIKKEDEYICYNKAPLKLVYDSYNVLYSKHIIDNIINDIKYIFRMKFSITLMELYNSLSNYKIKFVQLAIRELSLNKIPIIDRYGYPSYIREDGKQLYILREYPTIDKLMNTNLYVLDYYSNNLTITNNISISNYISKVNKKSNILIKQELLSTNVLDPTWENKFEQLTLDNKIILLENALYDIFINKNKSEYNLKMYNKFKKYIYIIYEPTLLLSLTSESIANRGKGRGRKPLPGNIPQLKILKDHTGKKIINYVNIPRLGDQGVSDNIIYIHTANKISSEKSAYAVSSKFAKSEGELRILNTNEVQSILKTNQDKVEILGWRDSLLYETLIYNEIINKMKSKTVSQFDILPFYGFISSDDNKFRIRFKLMEKSAKDNRKDNRKVKRGRVASSYDLNILYYFMWYMYDKYGKLDVNPAIVVPQNMTLDNVRQFLHLRGVELVGDPISMYSDKRLIYYYRILQIRYTKAGISKLLQKVLTEAGMIMQE